MSDDTYTSRVLISWIWHGYLKKYKWLLALAIMFMVIEGSTVGALSYLMQPMFDDVFVAGNEDALVFVAVGMLVVFTTRGFSAMMQKLLLNRASLLTSADLRQALLNKLMTQDGSFHKDHPPGYLIQRIQGDVGAVNNLWKAIMTGAGRDVISLIALLAVAINIDWRWTAVTCFGIPLLLVPISMAQRYVRQRARISRDLSAGLATRLDEVFHGIVPVKLNALERYQSNRYRSKSRDFVRNQTRAAVGSAIIPGMIDLMAGIGVMGVILYGGTEIISGEKTVGQFMSFFTAIGLAFDPMRRLGAISGVWQQAAASVERVKGLMDAPVLLTSPANPVPPPKGLPEITLNDVSLSYGDAQVLHGLTMVAKSGETTALVGASGAGKSTVFNLLTRLIDPQEGQVKIGGIEARDMALPALRGLFSVVTQEALLFDDTLRENILLGRTDVSDEQLKTVLDAAHVSDFLPKLEFGLDTQVGPRGSALSGGQRQRVVIARALLRDTPILLLDEATSALDAQSEKVVQAALDRLTGGRTTIVIAHRLSTIRNADKIIVMDRGKVVDQGTHDSLLEGGGIYADLYRLQFEDGKTVIDPDGQAALAAIEPTIADPQDGWLARVRYRLFG